MSRELQLLEARSRFIELVVRGEVQLGRTSKKALVEELQRISHAAFAPRRGGTPNA